jgi:hypothetical protein
MAANRERDHLRDCHRLQYCNYLLTDLPLQPNPQSMGRNRTGRVLYQSRYCVHRAGRHEHRNRCHLVAFAHSDGLETPDAMDPEDWTFRHLHHRLSVSLDDTNHFVQPLIKSSTCVTSIVRMVLLLPTLNDPDQPWGIAIASIWIGIEANLVIICCSLPTLRLFVRHFAPKLIGEYSLGRSKPGAYGNTAGSHPLSNKFDKLSRTRSTYDRMGYSETGTDVELQPNHTAAWSECRRGSENKPKEETQVNITRLDDETPPGTAQPFDPNGITVTRTFGAL